MADNSTLNSGTGGDTLRDVDKSGVKTQVVILDIGGAGAESLLTGTLPVSVATMPLPTGAATEAGNLATIAGKDFATQTTLALVATAAKQDTGNTSVASIDTKTPALGQALAAASVPIVLTAIQQTALTPPAAITGFALEAGHLAAIDTSTAKIPAQGQALAAASMPVVLTAIQQTALTPPAAITGFALEAGHLATIDTSTAKIPSQGQALAAASMPVVLPAAQITTLTPPAAITGFALEAGNLATIAAAVRAEDTVASDADKGIGALAVRKATPANTSGTDGDYEYLQINSGRLWTSAMGEKTNNAAAPGATNFGVLDAIANAALPTWTEGNQVAQSVDLSGGLRVVNRPAVVLGAYRIHATTAQYAGLTANATLISFRYTATNLCIVTRVRVFVTTQTAATAAGRIDRALMVVRGFTVADSGGTAIALTSPVGKLRTSHAATGVGNLMVLSGSALTKGTGTEDANPFGVIATAGTATEGIGLTLPKPGQDSDLIQSINGSYPLVLAQNEGFRISIPTAMPATIAMITAATIEWYEVTAGNF